MMMPISALFFITSGSNFISTSILRGSCAFQNYHSLFKMYAELADTTVSARAFHSLATS